MEEYKYFEYKPGVTQINGKEVYQSNRKWPKTVKQAFEKSIEKWDIVYKGHSLSINGNLKQNVNVEVQACGLCNYYENKCKNCILAKKFHKCCTTKTSCLSFDELSNYYRTKNKMDAYKVKSVLVYFYQQYLIDTAALWGKFIHWLKY